jgi:hypothetical protein
VTYYTVDGVTAPTQRYAFQVGSKPLNVALHPTTAGVSLVTATSPVVSIYDVSASAPALTLNTAGDAPLWSAAWSSDGRLVGGVTKKEQAVVWDARAGSAPVHAKDVGMQPLKPARVAFVGTDLFVSSFSRTRMRQYALFSSSLETIVSQSVDTEQAPLVPLVDDERRVVYALGRGDMRLRQIEFVGQQSQEVTHALPSQASSGGLALAHWSTLPVMEAHIAHVLVPTIDKEGDTLLPLTIKVPRRQLIDYHSELFPDVTGSVPEQSAAEWLQGGDKRPLPVSLDPSRREAWLKAVEEGRQKIAAAAGVESAPAPAPAPAAAPPQPPAAVATPAAPAAPAPAPVENTVAKAAEPEPATTAPPAAATAIATGTATAAAVAVAATTAPTASTTTPSSTSLPPLEYGETYSSTSYKARNVGERILEYRKTHLSSGSKGPLMVGLQGPQGCGKTTLCDALLDWLRAKGLRVAVLSLDGKSFARRVDADEGRYVSHTLGAEEGRDRPPEQPPPVRSRAAGDARR